MADRFRRGDDGMKAERIAGLGMATFVVLQTLAYAAPAAPSLDQSESAAESLFSATSRPINVNVEESASNFELGIQFKSAVKGYITGLRFYKGDLNKGVHFGNLWDSSGVLLASAQYTNETASGWQEVEFIFPVEIMANTVYTASYHGENHYYSADSAYFTNAVVNGDITAPASINGVRWYGADARHFPTTASNNTNYWVDVVFARRAKIPPTTTTYPTIGAQLPHLLDSYSHKPSWSVAGVNYGVGVADGQLLHNPALISMAGVKVNENLRQVTVIGDNVTLDSFDFTLNGGWGVIIASNNVTISNSNFLVGSNGNAPILGTQSSGNVTVTNCTIDGNNSGNVGGLIEMRGAGALTVDHSWLKNSSDDIIQMHNNGPSALVAKYNLIQNAGMTPGAHGDFTEFLGGPFTATIIYNTTTEPSGGSSQGFMVEPDLGSKPGVILGGEIGNNTMTGYNNVFTGITVADLAGKFTVHDNYFDPSHTSGGLAFGGVRGGPNDRSPMSFYLNNVNMVSGVIIRKVSPPAGAIQR
ncbi:DUF4082 domain-containing protein [Telmatospirillum sp.]|uniref:DUF4082 domain-containing protein n=1 Tax=Telmatospirillum sp. TaxID=2079197 RepID=UPI002848F612|nr:DUF4082 domain-containing protein [Telmatospirillum sp.]MDR3437641.1 DUF4082 domain-containing protein [Telmatospirillum sp.]